MATPAFSDTCLPQQQHVHQYIRAHYAVRSGTHIAYRRAHLRRQYVMMEEPYYDAYDEYYDASGPYWHARSGWWEWHPTEPDNY